MSPWLQARSDCHNVTSVTPQHEGLPVIPSHKRVHGIMVEPRAPHLASDLILHLLCCLALCCCCQCLDVPQHLGTHRYATQRPHLTLTSDAPAVSACFTLLLLMILVILVKMVSLLPLLTVRGPLQNILPLSKMCCVANHTLPLPMKHMLCCPCITLLWPPLLLLSMPAPWQSIWACSLMCGCWLHQPTCSSQLSNYSSSWTGKRAAANGSSSNSSSCRGSSR